MATTKTVTENIPGLQEAPEGGKFVVRKNKDYTGEPGEMGVQPESPWELFLIVPDEGEYKVNLFATDDGNINGSVYQVIQLRRGKLRENLFNENDEVELTNK